MNVFHVLNRDRNDARERRSEKYKPGHVVRLSRDSDAALRAIWRLVQAAQSTCQSVNGSDPDATKRTHEADLVKLREALKEMFP